MSANKFLGVDTLKPLAIDPFDDDPYLGWIRKYDYKNKKVMDLIGIYAVGLD